MEKEDEEHSNQDMENSEELDIPLKKIQQSTLNFAVILPSENDPIYFPIMEFESSSRAKINELELIRRAIERDRNSGTKHVTTFYFFSPPGLGKTVMGGFLAKCYKCPYQIVNCVSSMIDLDLLGSQILVGENTVWQDGPITSIIRATNQYSMGILIINELNALTVNAQMALNPLLDRQEGVVLTQNNNEFVKMENHAHLLIIASMNPDVLGINDLQDSVRDRASAILSMNYPTIEKEAWLIQRLTSINEEWATKYCEVIAECRKANIVDKTISKAPSTRALIDWINYSTVWGPFLAFELTIANRYCAGINMDEAQILLRIASGKGVKKWKLPENLINDSLNDSDDEFFFPIPTEFEIKKAKVPKPAKKNMKPLTKGAKRAMKNQLLKKRLNLNPLDNFMQKKAN
ncbi:AAA family ATPase [Candidatus Lokiarchaeum ossiferum]|uniref:AAA family ATPase n=1 Tax=Candidatus Lokiarchaeum ossiferum TaxID=2951803 RepID=UPI00352D5527